MPQVVRFLGYIIYYWAHEENEPIHVHVCKGDPTPNATKIWIQEDGPHIAHNRSRIPTKDMKLILSWLSVNKELVIEKWHVFFEDEM